MKSAIQTLTDGLVYCKNYLRDNPNCSGENKSIKQQQIAEHEKALKILTTDVDASKNTLPIQNVSNSVCSMKGKGFCPHEFDNGKCDYVGTCTNKQTDC